MEGAFLGSGSVLVMKETQVGLPFALLSISLITVRERKQSHPIAPGTTDQDEMASLDPFFLPFPHFSGILRVYSEQSTPPLNLEY